MTSTGFLFVLLALALLITTTGFRRFVYFLNVGYAFSITAMCIAAAIFFRAQLNLFSILQLAGLTVWGLRLGIFVLRREARPSYQKESVKIQDQYGKIKRSLQIVIWISVAILYVLMFLPAFYHLCEVSQVSDAYRDIFEIAGCIFLWGGLAIESIADRQKSAYKALHPTRFCDEGLYRWVRCPNYLGEICIWLGSWTMGIPYYTTPWHWAGSLIGLLSLVYIMLDSAKRLEMEQTKRYGTNPEYQAYVRSVPVLFPFLPVFSLQRSQHAEK